MATGSRGAKGSINDRLISQMYRERYKKKYRIKKDSYKYENKKIEKVYIEQLRQFQKTNNVDNLDFKDQGYLGEVEIIDNKKKTKKALDIFNDKFKIDEKSEIIFEGSLKETPLDLEKEEKRVKDEVKIIEEVKEEIDKTIKEAVNIKKEMDELTVKMNETNDKQKLAELHEKYNRLVNKLNKLKEKYHIMHDKYNFDDYKLIENYTLDKTVDEYKLESSIEELEMLVEFCQNESEEMKEVVEEDKIASNQEAISNKEKVIENDYEYVKQMYDGLDKYKAMENFLFEETVNQAKIIAEIDRNMYKVAGVYDSIDFQIDGVNKMASSFLKIAAGFASIPISFIAPNKLGIALIKNGANKMNKTMFYKKNKRYKYFDLSREIMDGKDQLKQVYEMIDKTTDEVLMIEYNFKEKYKKYAEVIPEYNEVLKKLGEIKKVLSQKSKEFDEYKYMLEKADKKNSVKVKK